MIRYWTVVAENVLQGLQSRSMRCQRWVCSLQAKEKRNLRTSRQVETHSAALPKRAGTCVSELKHDMTSLHHLLRVCFLFLLFTSFVHATNETCTATWQCDDKGVCFNDACEYKMHLLLYFAHRTQGMLTRRAVLCSLFNEKVCIWKM